MAPLDENALRDFNSFLSVVAGVDETVAEASKKAVCKKHGLAKFPKELDWQLAEDFYNELQTHEDKIAQALINLADKEK